MRKLYADNNQQTVVNVFFILIHFMILKLINILNEQIIIYIKWVQEYLRNFEIIINPGNKNRLISTDSEDLQAKFVEDNS